MKFSELELDPKVVQAVEEAGYTSPTPIQAQAIPEALKGRDVLGIAQTGTGKTASFTLPMISILAQGRARARMPRSLILAPTRELAAQVAENFEKYGKYHKLTMALLIGGVSFKDQDKLIDRGVDVLIATPGRLLDHFERGKLMLTGVQIMVVDEADRMLDMGFIPDIERIFKLTPFTRQTLFFSATMPPEITRLTQEFLSNPMRIEVAKPATTAETVEQRVCKFKPSRKDNADKEKRAVLRELMRAEGDALKNAIIFCNRKRDVGVLYKSLSKHGFNAAALHGDLDQSVRMATLNGFRDGTVQFLVASDVAARGLDIPSVSHVFNFDVPIHADDYVHRIGRTGRAGRSGKALMLCLPGDQKHLDKIEELVNKPIPEIAAPEGALPGEDVRSDAVPDDATRPSDTEKRRPRRGSRRDRAPETEAAPTADVPEEAHADGRPDPGSRIRERREERPEKRERGADRGGRNRRRDRDDGPPVVGLGDHVPAFLLRPVVLPKRSRSTKASDEAASPDSENSEADAA